MFVFRHYVAPLRLTDPRDAIRQWIASPACTELEQVVMDWGAKLFGLGGLKLVGAVLMAVPCLSPLLRPASAASLSCCSTVTRDGPAIGWAGGGLVRARDSCAVNNGS